MLEKNKEYELTIDDYGNDGEGIGHIDSFAVFVKGAAKGDRALVRIIKVKKSYAYGRLMKVIEPSPDRQEPACPHAMACGGCSLMHISYERQLAWKQERVRSCLERIGKIKNAGELMEPVAGLEGGGLRYRNKAQFPVGKNKDGSPAIGFYATHSHRIVDTKGCLLQPESFDGIIALCRTFLEETGLEPYDEESGNGVLRHIVIRESRELGQIQVCFVANAASLGVKEEKLVKILSSFEGIASIVLIENREKTNRIMGDRMRVLWGKEKIEDRIGQLGFLIGPLSFYQVNPTQTVKMYEKALEYAALTGNETVFDLYCGIGTISLFLAQKAKRVIGVEIVPKAIEDAKQNAEKNGITNAEFYAGKAEELLPTLYENEGISADVIVVDPPRKGCDETAIATMLKMQPQRIVYVSCDPATLARDIAMLTEGGYVLEKVCAFDNFCQTTHVETVVLLNNKFAKAKGFVQIGIDAEDYYRIKDSEKDTDE